MSRCSDIEMEDLRICDPECMGVNNCGGHDRCSMCDGVFCGCELDENGLCEDCAAMAEAEAKDEEEP